MIPFFRVWSILVRPVVVAEELEGGAVVADHVLRSLGIDDAESRARVDGALALLERA